MDVLEYYTMRKEKSAQDISTLITEVKTALTDTQAYLDNHSDEMNKITEIKLLVNRLNNCLSKIDSESAKLETLKEVCLSLSFERGDK